MQNEIDNLLIKNLSSFSKFENIFYSKQKLL
jgi:hypothetical protein